MHGARVHGGEHAREHGARRAGRPQRLGVEGHREERPAAAEEELSRGLEVAGDAGALEHLDAPAGRQLHGVDRRLLVALGAVDRTDREERRLAARQGVRPSVGALPTLGVERRHRHGRPSRRRDAHEPDGGPRREEDGVVREPHAAAAVERLGDGDDRAAGDRRLLQLAVGEEGEPAAVGREEGVVAALRAGERPRLEAVERAHVDALLAPLDGEGGRQEASVGGDGDHRALLLGHRQRGTWRQVPGQADGAGARGRGWASHAAPEPRDGEGERDGDKAGDRPWARPAPVGACDRGASGRRRLLGAGRRGQRLLELEPRVAEIPQPPRRVLLEATPEQAAHLPRSVGGERAPVDLALQDGGQGVRDRLAAEGAAAAEHLVEDAAEGPDVGAAIGALAARLLGAHVGGGAEEDAGAGALLGESGRMGEVGWRALAGLGRERLGEAEVEHLHRAVAGELDVGGLQVAVDDTALVGVLEGLGDLAGDRQRLVERQRAARQPIGQGRALDQLHDQEAERRGRVRRLEGVEHGDARVVERGQDLGLALEAAQPVGVGGDRLGQHLDRHLAVEPRVARPVDLAHAAGAERGEDFVGAEARAQGERHGGGGL